MFRLPRFRWILIYRMRWYTGCLDIFRNYYNLTWSPRELLRDRGTNFILKLYNEIWTFVGTHKWHNSSWNPKADCLCERFNKTLGQSLRMYASLHQRIWIDIFLVFCFLTDVLFKGASTNVRFICYTGGNRIYQLIINCALQILAMSMNKIFTIKQQRKCALRGIRCDNACKMHNLLKHKNMIDMHRNPVARRG